MSKISPIFIPSKGRFDKCQTALLLEQAGLNYKIVVEPQELDAYQSRFGSEKVISLPENDRGISFSRQWILEQNDNWYWQIDDDIRYFYQTIKNRNVKVSADVALSGAEKIIRSSDNVALGALAYSQFAWSSDVSVKYNTYCYITVLIDGNVKAFANYDPSLILKEDVDMTLQVLSAGFRTAQVQTFSHAVPKMGSNKGGLQAAYAQEHLIKQDVERLSEKYPEVIKPIIKRNGSLDARVNWRYFG